MLAQTTFPPASLPRFQCPPLSPKVQPVIWPLHFRLQMLEAWDFPTPESGGAADPALLPSAETCRPSWGLREKDRGLGALACAVPCCLGQETLLPSCSSQTTVCVMSSETCPEDSEGRFVTYKVGAQEAVGWRPRKEPGAGLSCSACNPPACGDPLRCCPSCQRGRKEACGCCDSTGYGSAQVGPSQKVKPLARGHLRGPAPLSLRASFQGSLGKPSGPLWRAPGRAHPDPGAPRSQGQCTRSLLPRNLVCCLC